MPNEGITQGPTDQRGHHSGMLIPLSGPTAYNSEVLEDEMMVKFSA